MKRRRIYEKGCDVDGCSGDSKYPQVAGLCHACYSSFSYHFRKGLAHCLKWTAKVDRFGSRVKLYRSGRVEVRAARRRAS